MPVERNATKRSDIRPDDHDERMAAARERAQWELGDGSWAGIIIGAYLWPDEDRSALDIETADAPQSSKESSTF